MLGGLIDTPLGPDSESLRRLYLYSYVNLIKKQAQHVPAFPLRNKPFGFLQTAKLSISTVSLWNWHADK